MSHLRAKSHVDIVRLCVILLITVCERWQGCTGFNVDTKYPIIFAGSKDSYFGFSVALHENNADGKLALIAATRADSANYDKQVRKPGVLYKCSFDTTHCREIILDKIGNTEPGWNRSKEDREKYDYKNDMWLGISLDVQPKKGTVVTCGHLWKNHFYMRNQDVFLPKGACYVIDKDLNSQNVKKLVPFVDENVRWPSEFDLAGFSATFGTDQADGVLILGAPGYAQSTGTVVHYDTKDRPSDYGPAIIPKLPSNESTPIDAYAGYSVTTGKFLKSEETLVAVGAPRDAQLRGKVYIFRVTTHKGDVRVKLSKEGEQMGEYFGASVLGLDLNNDQYTDLLVSAPLHSTGQGGDEGRVYVFVSNGNVLVNTMVELMGRKKPGARFGSCLASIGDINQDTFPDVAIGAPYEDYRGVVYIYHGNSNGLNPKFQQVITAESINDRLRGFGISISRGQDMDNNNYPDLLIGSYASDQAVLLRTSPVVQVIATLEFDTPQINLAVPECNPSNPQKGICMKGEFCFLYTGNNLPGENTLKLRSTLEADATKREFGLPERSYFLEGGNPVSKIPEFVTLTREQKRCFFRDVYVQKGIKDIHSPMVFRLTYELEVVRTPGKFCKLCPVLDKNLPTVVEKSLVFQAICGDDDICKTDLKLTAAVKDLKEGETLIHGQNKTIIVDIKVKNTQEFAYQTRLEIQLPRALRFINKGTCEESDHQDSYGDFQYLTCAVANPLETNQIFKTQLKLDISRLSIRTTKININISVETTSVEIDQIDNRVLLEIPIKAHVGITMIGYPDIREIFYKKDNSNTTIDFSHIYIVTKNRPTSIEHVVVDFCVPIALVSPETNNRLDVIKLKSVRYTGDMHPARKTGQCRFSEESHPFGLPGDGDGEAKQWKGDFIDIEKGTDHFELPDEIPTHDEQREPLLPPKDIVNYETPLESKKIIGINCSTALHRFVRCYAGPFEGNRNSASFRIDASLNLTALRGLVDDLGKVDVISITTTGDAVIQDAPSGEDRASAQVTTDIFKDMSVRPVAPWIIVVSVLAGIFLLVLIAYLLYKFNFFKRHRHPQLEEMEKSPESEDKKCLNPPEDPENPAEANQDDNKS